MINDFLAYLDNNPAPPDQSTPPVVIWPAFEARTIVGAEAALRGAIIGTGTTRLESFMRCVQLTNLVAESPFQDALTFNDPRVTYTKTALRELFTLQGFVVQSPFPVEAVFTALPGTPSVGRWSLRVLSAAAGNGMLSVLDDRGGRGTAAFSYTSQNSGLITFPGLDGAVTLYGTIAAGQFWEISFRQKAEPWVLTAMRRLDTVSPLGFLSPRLAHAYRVAPLKLDRLAAVVAGLGGVQ
jgi:hypothetical protein